MNTIYYLCKNCEEHNPEGSCYPREMVRVAKTGAWVCENCYDDYPEEFAEKRPLDEEDFEYPRWSELSEVPNHVPEVTFPSGDR